MRKIKRLQRIENLVIGLAFLILGYLANIQIIGIVVMIIGVGNLLGWAYKVDKESEK